MKFVQSIAFALTGFLMVPAFSQAANDWPNKPVRIVVSTAPGGGADVTARLLAPELTQSLGQSVVVENRPGASGTIAGETVARQPADGYTLLFDITTISVNPSLLPQMSYRPLTDLAPIAQVIQAPNVLVVHPSVPVSTLQEFIAYAKARNGELAFASSGNGSSQHLAAALFMERTGIKMNHVPYKGGGPALNDVIAGHVPVFFAFLSSAAPHIKAGRLKPIAVTGNQRSAMLPEVPTVIEAGLPGYEIYDFNGLFAPAGTPTAVLDKIQRAVAAALASPRVKSQLDSIGAEPVGSTPAAFTAFLHKQTERWAEVVKRAGITVE